MTRSSLPGVLAVTLTAVLWGTTGTAATFAPEAGPLAIGAAALGIGGILQAAIAVPELRRSRDALRPRRGLVLVGALAVFAYPLAFYSSMHLAGVAIGSVVSLASAPLASGALERLVEGKVLSRWWLLAAGLGITGGLLLCVSAFDEPTGDPWATLSGTALGLVAGASYALYSWVTHRLMSTGVSRAAAMGAVFGLGGTLLLPILLLTGAPLLASAPAALTAGYMALVPMFLGYLLFGYGLTRISASAATTITLVEPAVAAVLAVLIVGERLSIAGWAGLAVVSAALLVLALAPAHSRSAAHSRSSTRSRSSAQPQSPGDPQSPAQPEDLSPSASPSRGRTSPPGRAAPGRRARTSPGTG
jgi:DME family drug/metabolite transporter